MSILRIRPRMRIGERLDLGPLRPDRLGDLSEVALRAVPLRVGAERVPLETLFDIELGPGDARLEVLAEGERFDGIGAGLRRGRIDVRGNAGAWLGRDMKGGEIHVHGDCGAYAATGMAGGRILVDGDCGDFLAAPEPGLRRGMHGGTVIVRGNAGDRAGERLRRGMIFIQGDAGLYCGARMLAGSLAVLGRIGRGAGFGMRRGTLFLRHAPPGLPATLNDGGETQLVFLRLWSRQLARLPDLPEGFRPAGEWAHRWVGDMAVGGQGEILQVLQR